MTGQEVWRFAEMEFDLRNARLMRAGQTLAITPLLLSVLSYLVRHHDRIVTREELSAAVWPDVAVGEGSLRQAIWELRQKLGESAVGQSIIQTVRSRGYRFVAPVEQVRPAHLAHGASSASAVSAPTFAVQGLFGRQEELLHLRSLLAASAREGGRACAIVGPPGVGKSRLARVLAQSLPSSRSFVEGHADANRSAPAFWPWLQMVNSYVEASPESRPRYAELAPAVFRLLTGAPVLSGAPQAESSRQQQRFLMLSEMGRLFVTLASDAPGLLLFEDLQWADEASLAFLLHLLPLLARTRSLLVLTCRAVRPRDERAVARALRELTRTTWSEQLELRNLTARDIEHMLGVHTRGTVTDALRDQVFELSRGNPLFASEFSRLLAKAPAHGAAEAPPGTSELQSLVQRRLLALPDEALTTVRAAAVLSSDFALAELAGVLDEPVASVLSRVDQCFEQEVFIEGQGSRFRFAHPLLRESAYALLSLEERCRMHRRAGEWLESHGADAQVTWRSELARHFVAAAAHDCVEKAIRYATDCAAVAYASTAYADCVLYYEQALSCAALDKTLGPELHLELELSRGEAQRAAGVETERINDSFLKLAQRAEALRSPTLFARAVLGYVGQCNVRFTPTRFPPAAHADRLRLLEKALRELGPAPSELRALLLCSLSAALFYTTERARREAAVDEALQIATTLATPWLSARALATRIYFCAAPDARDQRLADCDALIDLTREHMLMVPEAEALMTRAVLRLSSGLLHEAEEDVVRARHLAQRVDLPDVHARCALLDMMRAFWTGDLPLAKKLTEQSLAAKPEDIVERAFYVIRMTALDSMEHGLRPQTIALHEGWLAEHPNIVGVHAVLASIYATLGQVAVAERHFDSATQDDFRHLPEDITWLSELMLLADTARRLDDRERASAVYRRLEPYGHLFDFFAGEGAPAGPVAYWLAELAVTLGDYEKANDWLEVTESINARLGATMFQQLDRVCRARLIVRSQPEQLSQARQLLSEARRFAERAGVALVGRAVREVEQELAGSREERRSRLS